MYSTIGFGTASKAAPQGRFIYHAEVGFELAIKRWSAQCLDHYATTSLILTLCIQLPASKAARVNSNGTAARQPAGRVAGPTAGSESTRRAQCCASHGAPATVPAAALAQDCKSWPAGVSQ